MRIHDWSWHARRLAFVLVNASAFTLIVSGAISAVVSIDRASHHEIALKERQLAHLRSVSAGLARSDGGMLGFSASSEFLQGVNIGAAEASVQGQIKQLIETAGARPQSIAAFKPPAVADNGFVGVRVTFVGTFESNLRVVGAIESSKPYLFVASITLKRALVDMPRDTAGDPVIQADMEILAPYDPSLSTRP